MLGTVRAADGKWIVWPTAKHQIGALVNAKEESTRLRARVAHIASTRRWAFDAESAAALEARPVRGYVVRDGVLVATA